MDLELTPEEARVMGCLLEKKMATPEYYPLTLNALANACNQKVNRLPVVVYDEAIVRAAAEGLREQRILWINMSGRVAKYGEGLVERYELTNDQAALLCVLLLRGPQTVGELRSRSERLSEFADLETVHQTLAGLAERGFAQESARQPGQKETRFCQLLSVTDEIPPAVASPGSIEPVTTTRERITDLEEKVTRLTANLEDLQQAFARFKEQFE